MFNFRFRNFGRPVGDKLTISKLTRKVDQMRKTIEQLHERLAALQSSKRNKASQIARLKACLERYGICDTCERKDQDCTCGQ